MKDVNQVLQNLRGSYLGANFDIEDTDVNPSLQFEKWLKEAINAGCDEPNAFVLSTLEGNKPRARVLLLKGLHQEKFVFYTNYASAKGREIKQNDNVALTFLWLPLQRQVRIEGKISLVDAATADEYFMIRPRGSQLGAIASPQSQKIASRQELEQRFQQVEKQYAGQDKIQRPANWGGYAVTPDYYEFWQGRSNRMHDRISYELQDGKWQRYRLAP
jgi:pyridoxamine 5'-phosphate oxidase